MDIDILDNILESLLFVSGNPLSIKEITELLELQKSEVDGAIKRLKEKYGNKCGIHLITYNGKVQFGSNPAYSDVISSILNPIKEKELSHATLETIAIIAYKQPVTKLEIEVIRGVSCDYAVQILLNHNLIEVIGRKDVVGKPLLYATTDSFLKRFQLEDLSQLPDYEELLSSIKVIEGEKKEKSLYNEFDIAAKEAPDENGQAGAAAEAAATVDEPIAAAAEAVEEEEMEFGEEPIPDFLEGEEIERIE